MLLKIFVWYGVHTSCQKSEPVKFMIVYEPVYCMMDTDLDCLASDYDSI